MTQTRPIEILLVEDNPGDVMLTQEAFSEAKISNNLQVTRDGEEAIAYLKKENSYEHATRPDLILLDLNLPKVNGGEVLTYIKSDKALMRIPVIVLTSSEAEKDIIKSYNLHANSYIIKPINFDQFVKAVNAIENFWFSVVALPPSESK